MQRRETVDGGVRAGRHHHQRGTITARFGNDDTLGTTHPAVQCNPGQANWTGLPNSLTCRRVGASTRQREKMLRLQKETL
jgi:hypothetical protein